MKYLILLLLTSCATKPCNLINREENIDGLKLTYTCGPNNDIIYRFKGIR